MNKYKIIYNKLKIIKINLIMKAINKFIYYLMKMKN